MTSIRRISTQPKENIQGVECTTRFYYTAQDCNILYATTPHYTTVVSRKPHYSTLKLHHTTLCHTTLHYNAPHYTILHHTALYYTTLHYITPHYTPLHHIALRHLRVSDIFCTVTVFYPPKPHLRAAGSHSTLATSLWPALNE